MAGSKPKKGTKTSSSASGSGEAMGEASAATPESSRLEEQTRQFLQRDKKVAEASKRRLAATKRR